MSARPPLEVHLYGNHVASILDTSPEAAVLYTAQSQDMGPSARLSLSLPVRPEVYPSAGAGGRWVRSLLPEGRALVWAVEEFGIPADDRFGLIAELGREVAGAVEILDPERSATEVLTYDDLDLAATVQIVTRADKVSLGLDRTKGVRLSLAGMQDKVVLHRIGEQWFQPLHGAPSTVIVKPEPKPETNGPTLDDVVTNELFCLRLAGHVGLDAAVATAEEFGDTRALVVERYDRRLVDDEIVRIHQEDLLSALGLDPLLKYERSNYERRMGVGGFAARDDTTRRAGPSLVTLAGVVAEHLGRVSLVRLLEAVTFNVAIGNADAHARNYSLLLHRDGVVEFAPLYDLVATRFYEDLDSEHAQLIDGLTEIDEVRTEHLVAEAVRWGLPESLARKHSVELVERLSLMLSKAAETCIGSGGDETTTQRLVEYIGERVHNLGT